MDDGSSPEYFGHTLALTLVTKLERKNHLKDLDIEGGLLLKWDLNMERQGMRIGLIRLTKGSYCKLT
jgi:hypothetical protein